MRSYIPQTLEEVIDVERDTLRVADGDGKDVSYKEALIGYWIPNANDASCSLFMQTYWEHLILKTRQRR